MKDATCAGCGAHRINSPACWWKLTHHLGAEHSAPFIHVEPFWEKDNKQGTFVCGLTCLQLVFVRLTYEILDKCRERRTRHAGQVFEFKNPAAQV